jgi:hypothetical protein
MQKDGEIVEKAISLLDIAAIYLDEWRSPHSKFRLLLRNHPQPKVGRLYSQIKVL